MTTAKIDLQAHVNFKSASLYDVLKIMDRNELDVVSIMNYERDSFNDLVENSFLLPAEFKVEYDDLLMKISRPSASGIVNRYFVAGQEVRIKDGDFHLVHIGVRGDVPSDYVRNSINCSLSQEGLTYIDHPFAWIRNFRQEIPKHTEIFLEELCKDYSGQIALEKNGYCKPWIRKALGGNDVNEMIEEFSERLGNEMINVPVIATTDLHAWHWRLLSALGKFHVEADVNLESGTKFVKSLKEKIFGREYLNIDEKYPSAAHFTLAFGIPYVKGRLLGTI